jgi:hypothetical protein
MASTVRFYATRGGNFGFLVQISETSDEPLQILHRKILRQAVDVVCSRVHPKRILRK